MIEVEVVKRFTCLVPSGTINPIGLANRMIDARLGDYSSAEANEADAIEVVLSENVSGRVVKAS